MHRFAIALAVAALTFPAAALGRSATNTARLAVADEVVAEYPSAEIVFVSCHRVTRTRFICRWHSRNHQNTRNDYRGSARGIVGQYGAMAYLYAVRCRACESGPPF